MRKRSIPTPALGLSVIFLLTGAARVQSQSVTMPAFSDTYITRHPNPALGGPDSIHGADTSLFAIGLDPWEAYPLVQFDLSSFAGRTIIGTPTFSFAVNYGISTADGYTRQVSLWEVAIPWDANSATYNNFGAVPGVQFGQDTTANPLANAPVLWPGSGTRYITWQLPVALVQKWVDDPGSNHGLLAFNAPLSVSSDLTFAALESGILPPILEVSVSPVPEPSEYAIAASLVLMAFCAWRRSSR